MARRRGNSTRYRRYRRRARLRLFDRLMVAGIWAGATWLALTNFTTMPSTPAAMLAVLVGGFSLGRSVRTPRLRSPIVWSSSSARGRRR